MRLTLPTLLIGLLLSTPAHCDEAVGEMLQQLQLNRTSQQTLRSIQDQAGTPAPSSQNLQRRDLNRKQQTEQQLLQEGQRRQVLMQKQRAKTAPVTGKPHRLQAIDRQSRFRLQQQNQLNRFRIQQGTHKR